MKYKAIIDTNKIKNFKFFEDGNGKYLVAMDDGATAGEWIPLYFKEVEKESAIDKVRAEIEQEYKNESEHPYGQGLRRALEIINKHKAESEEV